MAIAAASTINTTQPTFSPVIPDAPQHVVMRYRYAHSSPNMEGWLARCGVKRGVVRRREAVTVRAARVVDPVGSARGADDDPLVNRKHGRSGRIARAMEAGMVVEAQGRSRVRCALLH